MSFGLDENDFKNIFDTIYEISTFINIADESSLEVNDIKNLFQKTFYVEKLFNGLKDKGLDRVFEAQLNNYFKSKGKILSLKAEVLQRLSDEALVKMLTIKPSSEFLSKSIEEYLSLSSYGRFENVILRLSECRSLLVKLSQESKDIISHSDVTSSLLIQSWLKMVDCGEEGKTFVENIMLQMFTDIDSAHSVIGLLCLESSLNNCEVIQNLLLKVISAEVKNSPSSPSWRIILTSPEFVNIVQRFPQVLDIVFSTFEYMESRYVFDNCNKVWTGCSSVDVDYCTLLNIVKSLYKLPAFHFKVKKFIIIRKAKGSKEFWEYVFSELNNASKIN